MPKLPLPKIKAAMMTPEQMAAKEAFKSQFTPGYYHGSPTPNIKSFDSSKSIRGPEWTTPNVTFASPSPKFADDYTQKFVAGEPGASKGGYPTGATIYPVSINKGNHFDVDTPLGEVTVSKFIKESGMSPKQADEFAYIISDPHSNWNAMETTGFLDFLKRSGYDSFSVNEAGVKNVGVFDPARVRGKFADFDPAEAANPDFMKAQGGLINLK